MLFFYKTFMLLFSFFFILYRYILWFWFLIWKKEVWVGMVSSLRKLKLSWWILIYEICRRQNWVAIFFLFFVFLFSPISRYANWRNVLLLFVIHFWSFWCPLLLITDRRKWKWRGKVNISQKKIIFGNTLGRGYFSSFSQRV